MFEPRVGKRLYRLPTRNETSTSGKCFVLAMSHYRRDYTPGATYFFTVVTYRRRSFLCDDDVRNALRDAIN